MPTRASNAPKHTKEVPEVLGLHATYLLVHNCEKAEHNNTEKDDVESKDGGVGSSLKKSSKQVRVGPALNTKFISSHRSKRTNKEKRGGQKRSRREAEEKQKRSRREAEEKQKRSRREAEEKQKRILYQIVGRL